MPVTAFVVAVQLGLALAIGSIAALAAAAYAASDLLVSVATASMTRPGAAGRRGPAAALPEALLVLLAALGVVFAVLRSPTGHVDRPLFGAFVVGLTALAASAIGRQVERLALRRPSRRLGEEAARLGARAGVALVVAGALGVVAFTGVHAVDRVAALVIAALTAKLGVDVLLRAFPGRQTVSAREQRLVEDVLSEAGLRFLRGPDVRQRRTGGGVVFDVSGLLEGDIEQAYLRDSARAVEVELAHELEAPVRLQLDLGGRPRRR